MSDLVWEDPPAVRGHAMPRVWEPRLAPLRDRPGEWALLGRHAAVMVSRIKKGQLPGVHPGEFEATGRNLKDNKVDLYVRFVGVS